jgi:flavin-dependent trigonelline monooxygenase, oxygenase component
VPKPLQDPHPPLWLVARDAGSEDFAVTNSCNVQVPPLRLDEDPVEPAMRRFAEACAAHPEQARPQIMLVRHTFVGANEAELAQAAEDLGRHAAHTAAWFANERPVRRGVIDPLSYPESARAAAQFPPERMRRANVVGAPDTVRRAAAALRGDGLRLVRHAPRRRHGAREEGTVTQAVCRPRGAGIRARVKVPTG